ncbi:MULTISPECIES: Ig-like domain-containing protein [Haloferax]|uniref:Ig-like domain-containing protein n=1 Tax=Haloferax TaxID=2251 RepID=UPI001782FF9A|nr:MULTISPECIES: Ig-like domain-containing protein [Haloferax]
MEFLDSERGQSVQVGAILLFGILVIGLSLYQATVVPQETKSTEFEAYLDASDDLVSLHNDILTGATEDVQSGTVVQTGVRYRPRALFVNPGPPTGSLSLSDARTITVAGADAVDGEPDSVEAVWDGSPRQYQTKVLRYSPDYNEFDAESVSVTGLSVQRETGTNVVPLSGQTLLSGDRLTVVALDGRLGQAGVQTPLAVTPVTSAARTVTVTNSSGDDIEVTAPVGTNATAWNRSVAADRMRENDRVVSISDLDDATDASNTLVRITLDGDETYELRLAKVELTSASATPSVDNPAAEYIVPATTGVTAVPGGTASVVVEARDGYNNPVEGEAIDFELTGDATPTSQTITTNDDGRAKFTFTVDSDASGDITIEASSDFDDSGTVESTESTTYTIPVTNGSGGGSGSGSGSGDGGSTDEINPPNDQEGDVILEGARELSSKNEVNITLNNTGEERTISSFRVSFHYPNSADKFASGVQFNGSPEQDIGAQQYELEEHSVQLVAGEQKNVTLAFSPSGSVNADGDFFILSVKFDTGESATYFVAVPAKEPTSGTETGNGNGSGNGN